MVTENRNSAGKIRIVDQRHESVYAFDDMDGEITIDISDVTPKVKTPEGKIVDEADKIVHDGNASNSDNAGRETTDPITESNPVGHWTLTLVPCVLAIVGFGVGFAWSFDYFVPKRSPLDVLTTYGILVPFFFVSLAGTLWLYHDSMELADRTVEWDPDPWTYVLGGALVLEGYFVATALAAGPITADVLAALGGRFVVNLPIASIVAGPIYLRNRYRHLNTLN